MKAKVSKTKSQSDAKKTSVRIRETTKARALAKLKEINDKDRGRDLKIDDLLELSVARLTEEDVKVLQERSLSNKDRKEILRQKYVAYAEIGIINIIPSSMLCRANLAIPPVNSIPMRHNWDASSVLIRFLDQS